MVTRSALIYLSQREGLKEFATRFRPFKKLTTRFVAGETIEEAVEAIRLINADGCTASFDHLNESVTGQAEAEAEVRELLQDVLAEFDERHQQTRDLLKRGFERVKGALLTNQKLSEDRQLLLGAYFTHEYALEAAALSPEEYQLLTVSRRPGR